LRFIQSNKRKLYALLLIYATVIGIYYALPIDLTNVEWYKFYSYLDAHEATPYVDVREGYPPIGFLIYMPLYTAFRGNEAAFTYGFRAINAAFLIATLYTLYLISKSVVGEKAGLKIALFYAVLPSVMKANTYSNDVIALLPALLAIYMMQKNKAAFCGIFLGLATLSKGFPFLLIIPALITFTDKRDKIKVLTTTLLVLVFVSLPFMLANPLTYVSTFVHHGSRGPWETVWALIEGYHSHGGLLHPYFDKFFYHFNLLNVYPSSHYDHAIYQWNFDVLPNLLTFCQIGIVALLTVTYKKLKGKTVALCGLLYIGYMLFFKGYSTQFAVSTPAYLLLATMNNPLTFLVPLEASHILQMLSWYSESLGPEVLRDVHSPLLVSAIVLRTAVFAVLIANTLRSQFSLKQATSLIRRCFSYLKLFKDGLLVLLLSATIVMTLISSAMVCGYLGESERFRAFDGQLNVTESEGESINIDNLKNGDQIMVRLVTNTWLDLEIVPNDLTNPIECEVRNPYNLKDSFDETTLFFTAESELYNLTVQMAHPSIPFRVTDGLAGDIDINATSDESALVLKIRDEGVNGVGNTFRMAYPCSIYVEDEFNVTFSYTVIDGNVSNVLLDVFDDTDEWLYSFNTTENFVLKPDSKDIYGYSNLPNDHLSLVAISMFIDDNSSATIKLEELQINSNNGIDEVEFYARNNEEISYEIFIERDFVPSTSYIVALILTVTFGVATLHRLYVKIESGKQSHEPETISKKGVIS
jgi:hypothetical protein